MCLCERAGAVTIYLLRAGEPIEGFIPDMEIHVLLNLIPGVAVANGYAIGIAQLMLWLAIVVLFCRKWYAWRRSLRLAADGNNGHHSAR